MKFDKKPEKVITQIRNFEQFLNNGRSLKNCTLQALDFVEENVDWNLLEIDNTTFLGCRLSLEDEIRLRQRGAFIYRAPDDLPYRPFRHTLYTWQELMEGFSEKEDQSADLKIYQHFSANKFDPSINEALWQRIHDHAIDDALRHLLGFNNDGMTRRRCVGFMGGHGKRRDDPFFIKTARTAKLLTENGFFVVSGGGPGIMEAANLGAYFAGRSRAELEQALRILAGAPQYTSAGYHARALEVLEKYPGGKESLAIPTWFYGHEPSNLFASQIAKYFSNSIREDTLLAICLYGVVYAPGSAGTTQEIFMDATQNHYGTFNFYSPMVFLGRQRYEKETMIYPLLQQLAKERTYGRLLFLTDEPVEVVDFLLHHPPLRVE